MNVTFGKNIYVNTTRSSLGAVQPQQVRNRRSTNAVGEGQSHGSLPTHLLSSQFMLKRRADKIAQPQNIFVVIIILLGIRGLVGRARSESIGSGEIRRADLPVNKVLRRVQIESCEVDSVYDLREDGESSEFYNDSFAFRRPRSLSTELLILRKTSRPLSVDVLGLVEYDSDPYKQYMQVVDCYELAPHAGSVIVIDSSFKLQKAFKVLADWSVGSAIVCIGSEKHIITLTDFLTSLLNDDSSNSPITVADAINSNQLVTLSASSKLLDACYEFCSNRVHRIVVYDQAGDILYLLTIKRILQAVHKQNRSLHFASWLSWNIRKAKIGTWKKLYTVRIDDMLEKAARLMLDFRLSSLPIVDRNGRPIDAICKSDIANALTDVNDFQRLFRTLTVNEVVRCRQPTEFLTEGDTVGHVLDFALSRRDCRCVFITDAPKRRLLGAVSLSDFMMMIVNGEYVNAVHADQEKDNCTSRPNQN